MTLADELKRRIELKKALIILTEEEIAELDVKIADEAILELRLIEEEVE
mgnify:CR=1 FL=1